MDIIISFSGGPMDGETMTSDNPDPLVQRKVMLFARVIGGCLRDAEKREVPLNSGLTYSVPSEWLMDKAKRENWSDAKIKALMPMYEYEYAGHTERDGIAEIRMRFKEVKT